MLPYLSVKIDKDNSQFFNLYLQKTYIYNSIYLLEFIWITETQNQPNWNFTTQVSVIRIIIFFVCKCLMLEVMNFCMLMINITFFLLNITKAWRTHAPEQSYDTLKNHI